MFKFIKKHTWLLILIALCILFPQSLSNQAKLNMKSIVTGLAIDRKANGFEVTAQVVMPNKGSESGGGETQVVFITDSGKTVAEAVERIGFTLGKTAGLGHINFVLIGESMLENNVAGQLDYFMRDKKINNSVLVLACDGAAKDEIKKTANLEASSAMGMQKVFLYKQQETNAYVLPMLELANSVYSKSGVCLMSGLKIQSDEDEEENSGTSSGESGGGESAASSGTENSSSESSAGAGSGAKQNAKIKYLNKIYLLKKGKKVGVLESEDEIVGLLIPNRYSKDASMDIGQIEFANQLAQDFNVKYYKKKSKMKLKFEDGKIIAVFDVSLGDVKIRCLNSKEEPAIDYYNENNDEFNEKIRQKTAEKITELITTCFNSGKSQNVDVFMIADSAYLYNYKDYKKYIENNPNYIQNATVQVNVKIEKLT